MEKKHYGAIDGLRMIAAFGIVMMHMATNNHYQLSGFVYDKIIPSFTNFTFLFMVISAFGMCCGYYTKVLNNQITWSDFYGKRFKKILPFFGLLVLLDVAMSHSLGSVYEGFADLTLLFGFLPADSISVIGVGWFLGLVFVFYLIFPFFCVLIENKRRAWVMFGISLIYHFICQNYFDVGRTNILYSACFFLAGGLIYLYKEQIACFNKWLVLGFVWLSIILYYIIGGNSMMCLLVSSVLLVYAILCGGGLLQNKVTKFFSGISMEIYLSHMFIFRIIQKLKINTILGNGWIQYIVTVVVVIIGASVFAIVMKHIFNYISNKLANI